MSRVPLRLSVVLLVCLLETRAQTVVPEGPNPPRELNNHSLNVVPSNLVFPNVIPSNNETVGDDKKDFSIKAQSSEDSDPAESSETIVYNRFASPPEDGDSESSEEEPEKGPEDHTIPYAEHESPKKVSTQPNYSGPGQWARSRKNVSVEDVPSRLYAQVRRTHTVRRLPRKRAFENAESEEERANAARLRQVVRNTKVNTVYTEEGYEDSAYDHAGHVRDADFDEDYARRSHQQVNAKKASRNGRKSSPKSKKYKKIDPGEFVDYDVDYRDYEGATDRGKVDDREEEESRWRKNSYPKSIAEKGARKLQKDLEKEAEEMERGVEINKLEGASASSKLRTVTASPEEDNYGLKRNRDGSADQQDVYPENYSTSRTSDDEGMVSTEYAMLETTTMANNIKVSSLKTPLESYRYEVVGNSPGRSEVVDFKTINDESPTTASYSQLFWDYFRAKQDQQTTVIPFAIESATVSPNFLLPSPSIESTFAPFSAYVEQLSTPIPISEPMNPSLQKLVNPVQHNLNITSEDQDVKWQAANIHELPKLDQMQYPGANVVSDFIVDSVSSLDTTESSFAEAFPGPVTFRKPRYKITIRQKPVESFEDGTNEDTNSEGTTPVSVAVDPKYVKMLLHLRNEEEKKLRSSPPGNSFFHFQKAEGPAMMRPVKEDSYQSWSFQGPYGGVRTPTLRAHSLTSHSLKSPHLGPPSPRSPSLGPPSLRFLSPGPPSLITSSIGSPLIGPPSLITSSIGSPSLGPPPVRSSSLGLSSLRQGPLSSRQRSSPPSRTFSPPEHNRVYKETGDYIYGGTKPKRSRNFARPGYRLEAIGSLRARRRERRETGETGIGGAKHPATSSGVANRGEIEQAARNLTAEERNPLRKVTRGMEVGRVPDTVGLPFGEKPRASENERGEGSRAWAVGEAARIGESVSSAAEGVGEAPSELDAAKDREIAGVGGGLAVRNGDRKKLETSAESRTVKEGFARKRDAGEKEFRTVSEANETEAVNGKKIESEKLREKVDAGGTFRRRRSRSDINSDYKKEAEDSNDSSHLQVETEESDKVSLEENHEGLLAESPKIADDVISKEIDARFNEEEEKDDDEDEKVEVEVPGLPDFDYVEEAIEEEKTDIFVTTEASIDKDKYPFYENEKLPSPSALKYATDPRSVPGKTFGRMDFYKSRDLYKHCDEVEPSLDVLPREEKPDPEKNVNQNPRRLKGLGDKLDCFKAKYFDDDPFDNPLFLEKEVEDPMPALQVKSKQFASRIMVFPKEDEQNVVQKSSRKPEENPRNHQNHVRQRKPDTANARASKSRRIRIKNYPRQVTRPRLVRIKSSNVRYVKPRRPQKIVRRPVVASASELSSSYTPYQNQVYEDVMGTIKNMASSYQVEEITTVPSSKEDAVIETSEGNTNKSSNSTMIGKKEKNRTSTNSDERPSNSSRGGNHPPRHFNRHRITYKMTRVPQKGKSRVQLLQVTPNGLRPVSRLQRIVRYKRAAVDESETPVDDPDEFGSGYAGSEEATSSEESGEARTKIKSKTKFDLKVADPTESYQTSSLKELEAKDPKQRSKVPKTAASNDSRSKLVYTIRDRIRFSKPKAEIKKVEGKFGRFGNESETVEDRRRKEPRYKYIERRKPVPPSVTTELPSTEPAPTATTNRNDEANIPESTREYSNVQYFPTVPQVSTLNPPTESDQVEPSTKPSFRKTDVAYAVHEHLSEEQPHRTTSSEPPELSRLKSHPGVASPSYDFSSEEELKRTLFSNTNDTAPLNFTDSNEYATAKPMHRASTSDEDSSEKADITKGNVEPGKRESSEENASRSSDSESQSFFKYWSRPSSPAESYEDEKYKELGPRVNKPEFFHPPFSFLRSKKSSPKSSSEEDSGETDESEEKEEYVFPWHSDKVNEKKRRKRNRYYDKWIGEYEYPWDRRERLAGENRRKRIEERRRLLPDDEEDHDRGYTTKYRRNAYPRGRMRYWKRGTGADSSEEARSVDNVESSSETRPIKKYSSRYSSKKLPVRKNAESKRVQEISRSIKEALEGVSGEASQVLNSEETTVLPRGSDHGTTSRGVDPEEVTTVPGKVGSLDFAGAKKNESSNGSLRNSLDNVESRLAVKKESDGLLSKKEENSAAQSSRKRRKPVKNLSDVETTTKSTVNRGRRRYKPATVSKISTTPGPRVGRRRPSRLVDDAENDDQKIPNKLGDDGARRVLGTRNSVLENGTLGNRMNVSREVATMKRSQIGETKGEAKNSTDRDTKDETKNSTNRRTKETKDKLSELKSDEEKNMKAESESVDGEKEFDRRGERRPNDNDEEKKLVENGGRINFMDDRIEALSNFAKSDDAPDKFGYDSIVKSDATIPHNRAAQLSSQESREIISTTSWISQNFNF